MLFSLEVGAARLQRGCANWHVSHHQQVQEVCHDVIISMSDMITPEPCPFAVVDLGGRRSIDTRMESRMTRSGTLSGRRKLSDSDYRDQADFRRALRQFLHFSEEQARLCGITPQQHLLLLVVRGHRSYPNVSIGDAAGALQIRHHGASLLVDRSVKRGLLSRREDPTDRRRALVALTDEGQSILDRITLANRQELSALDHALFRDSLRQAVRHLNEVMNQS